MNGTSERDRKRLFSGIAIAGAVGLLLGVWQMGQAIRSPFAQPRELAQTQAAASDLDKLRTQDTDEDGMSDYAELYTYNTSPYLADSDSDGESDQQEIDAGTDPNCPKGEDCLGTSAANSNIATNGTVSSNSNTPGSAGNASSSGIDPKQLRETLKNAGAPQSVLDATSDADLLALYEETVRSSATPGFVGNTNTGGGTTNTNATTPISSIDNLTPAQVRQLLIENGASADEVNSIDDASLMAVYEEALKEVQNK